MTLELSANKFKSKDYDLMGLKVHTYDYDEDDPGWQQVYERIEQPAHSKYEYVYVTFKRRKSTP